MAARRVRSARARSPRLLDQRLPPLVVEPGDVLAREQSEADGKEQVLRSLGEAATRLREKLGVQKELVAVENTRTISKKSMVHNGATLSGHVWASRSGAARR